MMSIAKIEPDNLDYLFKHSTQEYFEEQENEKGIFLGRLSKFQGNENKEVTKKLYDKQMSFGEKDFKGVEIDPAPSKDWTVLYNRVDDKKREQMKEIWDGAIKEVAKSIEQNTYYRETKNGKTEYKLAKAVCIAKFDHHTARPVKGEVDCQEHSHLVIFPKVLGQDNKFHSHTLMDLKYEKNGHETLRLFDSVMNYHLAKGLNSMGHSVSPSKDGFTIDGLDRKISKEFSKRTNQIDDLAGENASYADKKKISLQVRENKTKNDIRELRKVWQDKMDSLGFTDTKKLHFEQKNLDRSLSEISKEKDKNVFSNKEIKTLAYQEATFSNKTFDEKLNEFKKDKKLEKVSSQQNIFKNSFAMQKFTKAIKANTIAKSLAKSSSLKTATPSKKAKPSKSAVKPIAIKNGSSPSKTGNSVQECLTEIKNLETELLSLALDDPKRANIEGKIGDLKEKMKSIEKEGKGSLTAKASIKLNSASFENPENEEEENAEKKKQDNKEQPEDLEQQQPEKIDNQEKSKKSDKDLTDDFSTELEKKEHLGNEKLNILTKEFSQNAINNNIQQVQAVQVQITPSL